jgi:hypothetical protein
MLFLFLSFLCYKIGEQEGRIGLAQGRGLSPLGGGSGQERGRRMNTVEKMCTHAYKNKNDTC